MAQKKNYSRYFIILQEDEKGYSLASDKIASGYAKLETKNDKCKISYYVQNLKKDKTPYYMILICNKKNTKKMINIGKMNIDDYGRADVSYEYPVANVCESGISVDKISGAAIVRMLDNNIISVMSGFASVEVPEWKSFDVSNDVSKNKGKQNEKVVHTVSISSMESKQEQKQEEKNDTVKTRKEKSIFDEYEENIERKKKETKENKKDDKKEKPKKNIDPVKEEEDKASKKVHNDVKESKPNVETEPEEIKKNEIYIDNSAIKDQKEYRGDSREEYDFFNELANGFEESKDVSDDLKRCKWYKVPADSMEGMNNMSDYNKYTFVYNAMASYYNYIAKGGYFLMGYKYDKRGNVRCLIYGIPGSKRKIDQPYGGRSGFVTWIPQKNKEESGYWLMFYDFRTGTVEIPVNR